MQLFRPYFRASAILSVALLLLIYLVFQGYTPNSVHVVTPHQTSDGSHFSVRQVQESRCTSWRHFSAEPSAWTNESPSIPSTQPQSLGVIVILARKQDREKLADTLSHLYRLFNLKFNYPVIVFHEDYETTDIESVLRLQASTAQIIFTRVEFCIPDFLGPVPRFDRSGWHRPVGYRHMIRFFAGMLFAHPALAEYEFCWRLDVDSRILTPITHDVFKEMKAHGWRLGFVMLLQEPEDHLVEGLEEVLAQFQATELVDLDNSLVDFMRNSNSSKLTGHIWNNFELMDLSFFRSSQYWRWFQAVDRSGIIYQHRVGDAPLHTLAAFMYLSHDEIHYFSSIGYAHDKRFTCPPAQEQICELWASSYTETQTPLEIRHTPCPGNMNHPICRIWKQTVFQNEY